MEACEKWLDKEAGVDPKVSFSYGVRQGWRAALEWIQKHVMDGVDVANKLEEELQDGSV